MPSCTFGAALLVICHPLGSAIHICIQATANQDGDVCLELEHAMRFFKAEDHHAAIVPM